MKNTENTLVAFHTSGGGGNRTKVKFIGQDKTIEAFTDHLFMGYENEKEVLKKLAEQNQDNEDYNDSDVLDCFSDRNVSKLKEVYGIEESELGEYGYKDQNGNWMDVLEGAETGTLDEDGHYDTTTVVELKDCDESEFEKILNGDCYISDDVKKYCEEQLGIEEETEDEE